MIKWLLNKFTKKEKKEKVFLCEFCDKSIPDDSFMLEFDMSQLAPTARFHADCFETNEGDCNEILYMIAQASEDRKREIFKKLEIKIGNKNES